MGQQHVLNQRAKKCKCRRRRALRIGKLKNFWNRAHLAQRGGVSQCTARRAPITAGALLCMARATTQETACDMRVCIAPRM